MNRNYLKHFSLCLLSCLMALCAIGCSEEEKEMPYLEVEPTSFTEVEATGTTLSIAVKSNIKWTVTSDKAWCKTKEGEHQGSQALQVTIEENCWQEGRNATLTLSSADGVLKEQVTVAQTGTTWKENHTYKLPVVFHVLYSREDNRQQYTEVGHLQKVMDNVNLLYRNCGTDMNLEFVMAPEDPDGNPLEEPGVHRLKWSPSVMNCNHFMKSDDQKYIDLLWDQNRYINIVLYTFSDNNLMGYSSFPYTVAPAELEGCEQIPSVIDYTQLNHPQCVSINNKFIYDMREDYTQHCDVNTYIPSDIVVTMAHEIAHYLGLRHAFSEDLTAANPYNACVNSDFCDDTPTYNKYNYDLLLKSFGADYPKHFDVLVERDNCETGEVYTSTNIMDYAVTYGHSFTNDQKNRIRYILENGIFIPGPKKTQPASHAMKGLKKVKLPIQAME